MNEAMEATNKLQQLLIIWTTEMVDVRKCNLDESEEFEFVTDHPSSRLKILKSLCKDGANLQYLETEHRFALIPHVFWSEELIQFFIAKGIDVNSKDENGDTALHLAIRHGLFDDETFGLQHGGCYNRFKRRDPNYNPVNVIQFLLDISANPEVKNLQGQTAILTLAAIEEGMSMSGLQETSKVAEMLMTRSNVKALNSDCESILHLNCSNHRFIDSFNGDVNLRSSSWLYSKPPLMVAASSNSLEFCRLLINKGADVNARDLQGYTALHHAVLNSAYRCAELLVNMGADPKEKSSTGKDSYILGIHSILLDVEATVFTYIATATKQVEILEIAGALNILLNTKSDKGQWMRVIKVCTKFELSPSQQFWENFRFAISNPNAVKDIYLLALNTVARLSEGNSKFWFLLSFFPSADTIGQDVLDYYTYAFENLNFLWQDELQRVEDFASLEETDFNSLNRMVQFFFDWLNGLEGDSKNEATPIRISYLHSIAQLTIACLRKLIKETKSCKVSYIVMKLYFKLCFTLTLLHSRFDYVITKTAFNDNKRKLMTLVDMDLADKYEDSLMHIIMERHSYYDINSDFKLVGVLLDFVDIKKRNPESDEPVQHINWEQWSIEERPQYLTEIMVKLADRGAHVDARNVYGGPTLREVFASDEEQSLAFRYDNLQCMCARVLVKSLVPYRSLQNKNMLPKTLVDFIDMHLKF